MIYNTILPTERYDFKVKRYHYYLDFFKHSLKLGALRPFQLAPAPCCQRLQRTRPWLPIRGREMSDLEMSGREMSGREMSDWRMTCFWTKHDTIKRREMKRRFLYALGGRGWQLWTCWGWRRRRWTSGPRSANQVVISRPRRSHRHPNGPSTTSGSAGFDLQYSYNTDFE